MKLAKITIFVGQETASVGSMAPVPGGASACTTHWVALGEQARRCRQPLWSEIGCRWPARPSEYTPEVCIFWLHAYMPTDALRVLKSVFPWLFLQFLPGSQTLRHSAISSVSIHKGQWDQWRRRPAQRPAGCGRSTTTAYWAYGYGSINRNWG